MNFNIKTKKILIFLSCFIILLLFQNIIYLTSNTYKSFDSKNFSHNAELIKFIFGIVAGAWILYEYYKNEKKQADDHLNLALQIEDFNNQFSFIKTSIHNSTLYEKKIQYAFLIISPFGQNFLPSINNEFKLNIEKTNDLYILQKHVSRKFHFINEEVLIIPLTFYFKENIGVGNEHLTYSLTIKFCKNRLSSFKYNYEIRFFVYRDPNDSYNYHRLTQCIFSSNETLKDLFNNYDLSEDSSNQYHKWKLR
jgi:hypothetical protein